MPNDPGFKEDELGELRSTIRRPPETESGAVDRLMADAIREIQDVEDQQFLDMCDLAILGDLIPDELSEEERRAWLKRHRNPRSWHQRLLENDPPLNDDGR